MHELRDKVAVITGGGSGIGRSIALALAASGVRVAVSDIDLARAEDVATTISVAGGEASGLRCDVSSDEEFASLRTDVLARFGRVDIVINNVGIIAMGRPEQIPISAWREIIEVNLLSVARSISVFLPGLISQGSGHIVNTASTAGLYAYSYERLPYSATKGAVVALTEALALYARPLGIGVSVLCPGPVLTNIVEQVHFYGEPVAFRAPEMDLIDSTVVGAQVVDAIRNDAFFVVTHPEVQEILVRKAADPEAFLLGQAEALRVQDESTTNDPV